MLGCRVSKDVPAPFLLIENGEAGEQNVVGKVHKTTDNNDDNGEKRALHVSQHQACQYFFKTNGKDDNGRLENEGQPSQFFIHSRLEDGVPSEQQGVIEVGEGDGYKQKGKQGACQINGNGVSTAEFDLDHPYGKRRNQCAGKIGYFNGGTDSHDQYGKGCGKSGYA